MTVARTQVQLNVQPPIGSTNLGAVEGVIAIAPSFSVTDSTDSTAAVYLGGLIPWRIINESGGAVTFTFYDALTLNGTALATQDQDSDTVPDLVVADDGSSEISSSLAGCTFLVIIADGAASGITLVCKR